MKVPPKRKGNLCAQVTAKLVITLNESPSEKEGKCGTLQLVLHAESPLNESPSEKEGKCRVSRRVHHVLALNESPSEKEGKSCNVSANG